MRFTFDPTTITRARQIIRHQPNLSVLDPQKADLYSPLVTCIEGSFKRRDADGMLLLPNLSALANTTVGIFSDYSGEGDGHYRTYSFLVCAWGSLDTFRREMKKVRATYDLGDKEFAFKDFRMGSMRRALPAYLDTLNGYVPGLLFTVIVEKKVVSLFGQQSRSTHDALARMLADKGFGTLKPGTAEKIMRIVHTAAYLTTLLGHTGQKVFWMSDHDEICATSEAHNRMLALFRNVLGIYTTRDFPLIGGARPFAERSTDYLDLLSAADVAAGSVGTYFTSRNLVGPANAQIKEGADKVLEWLAHDALALKKLCILITACAGGTVNSGIVEFTPNHIADTKTFLPVHLCR